ncbi:ABC transporter substrate-binding protein [Niveibacterium sp. 24ML]|uniref:ABC transporter substrate-binding protein n=1 Tax=Niveibacterium sp. 24ML TaxID=2985512 RepID=UPI002270D9E0|nr:ABC transporter substrate-binding protein [Niveibacterium sp. 24ML]MCX9155152.1 ABC transporter substrate-binding protein [Niveibacterium sp. 24ML]
MTSKIFTHPVKALAALLISCTMPLAQADITVLQLAPLTGPYGGVGWHMQVGASVAVAELNARGGINSQKLRLVTAGQEPGDIGKQMRGLIEKHSPVALLGVLGEDSVQQLLDSRVLEDTGLPLVGPRVGASSLASGSKQLFLTRPSFSFEVARVFKHHATSGIQNIGLVYEDNGFGREAFTAASSEAKGLGVKVSGVSYLAGSAMVDQAVSKMISAAPQAIVLASQTAGAAAFIQRYRAQGGTAQITTLSYVEGAHLALIIGKKAPHGVAVMEAAPNTTNESVPLVREFRSAYAKFGQNDVTPTQAMMESYVATRSLVEGLKRAGGAKNKLPAALASMERFDLGGLNINFGGTRRGSLEFAEMAVIDRQGRVIR